MKPNAPNVIERSIYWKRYVAANTRDPRQKKRCLEAIERLNEELQRSLNCCDGESVINKESLEGKRK